MDEIVKNQSRVGEEYLTISELASRLKLSPKTIKNKMASGIFKQGIHYFRPKGLRPRFKWSAIVGWLEGGEGAFERGDSMGIAMARGYVLKEPLNESVSRGIRR